MALIIFLDINATCYQLKCNRIIFIINFIYCFIGNRCYGAAVKLREDIASYWHDLAIITHRYSVVCFVLKFMLIDFYLQY